MKEGSPEKTKNSAPKEAFDPLLELEKIRRLPKEEKRQAVEIYKEKLMAQKEGIAELEEFFMEKFHEKPDAGDKYFLSLLETTKEKYNLSDIQYSIFRDTIREMVKRRSDIKNLRKKFRDNRRLFKELFGFRPQGEIKIGLGPLNFRIEIKNILDFATISENAFLRGRGATNEDVDEALITYGKTLTPLLEWLDRGVVIINTSEEAREEAESAGMKKPSYQKVLAHEEQHIFNAFLADQKLDKYFGREPDFNPPEKEKWREWLELMMRVIRKYGAEWNFKNEALAFLRGGDSVEKIKKILLDEKGHYESSYFVNKARISAKKFLAREEDKDLEIFIDELVEKVMIPELQQIKKRALDAVDNLLNSGTPRDKVISLLQNEPLLSWPNFARRYLKRG